MNIFKYSEYETLLIGPFSLVFYGLFRVGEIVYTEEQSKHIPFTIRYINFSTFKRVPLCFYMYPGMNLKKDLKEPMFYYHLFIKEIYAQFLTWKSFLQWELCWGFINNLRWLDFSSMQSREKLFWQSITNFQFTNRILLEFVLRRVSPLNGFRMRKSFTRAMETFLKNIRIDMM